MTSQLAQSIFSPRRIALVGASADPSKVNSRPQRYLRAAGFSGEIIPINPGRAEILGDRAYPSISDVPGGTIDHAFLMVPAPAIKSVVAECGKRGVSVATIFTAGFAETGEEGRAEQAEIVALAKSHGLRLIGPNCLGVIDFYNGMPLTTNAVIEQEELRRGPLSVISQSGSMLGCIMSRALSRGLGFSKLVSVGNECDIGVGELTEVMVEDPNTRAILLFLETFRDPEQLARASRAAQAAGKVVIAYKLGRSNIGRMLAASHTGAMVGGDEVANAFFSAHGIMRVETLDALFECASLVIGRKPPVGRRVSAITATGGGAAMVVDRVGLAGNVVVPPGPEARARLAAKGIKLAEAPIVDLPMGVENSRYPAILSELLAAPDNDAVLAVLGSSVRFDTKQVHERILAASRGDKPLAVFLAPEAPEALKVLQDNGVAAFHSPESCADALNAYFNWRAPQSRPALPAAVQQELDRVLGQTRAAALNELQSYEMFRALGIDAPECRVARAVGEVEAFDGPMAVKILSGDIAHKSDMGLVRLNVTGQEALDRTIADLLETAGRVAKDAGIDGVLVQPMQEKGLVEIILGYRRDPEIGPIIVLGLGGILAELRKSFTVRVAPVSVADASAMIDALPELKVLDGYRGLPKGDREALAEAIHRLSLLANAEGHAIEEAEINPLFVRPAGRGVIAVDGLVVRSS